MQTTSERFRLKLSYIPMLNLRHEFANYYKLLDDDDFRKQFNEKSGPYETPYFTWYGMPQPLLTTILQRVILGVEAYIPIAAYLEMNLRGLYTDDSKIYFTDPYRLSGKGTAEKYFHSLPSLIDKSLSLKSFNKQLFDQNKAFYKEVRNPLFHGFQIDSDKHYHLRTSFEHIRSIYEWLDSWHPPQKILDEINKSAQKE